MSPFFQNLKHAPKESGVITAALTSRSSVSSSASAFEQASKTSPAVSPRDGFSARSAFHHYKPTSPSTGAYGVEIPSTGLFDTPIRVPANSGKFVADSPVALAITTVPNTSDHVHQQLQRISDNQARLDQHTNTSEHRPVTRNMASPTGALDFEEIYSRHRSVEQFSSSSADAINAQQQHLMDVMTRVQQQLAESSRSKKSDEAFRTKMIESIQNFNEQLHIMSEQIDVLQSENIQLKSRVHQLENQISSAQGISSPAATVASFPVANVIMKSQSSSMLVSTPIHQPAQHQHSLNEIMRTAQHVTQRSHVQPSSAVHQDGSLALQSQASSFALTPRPILVHPQPSASQATAISNSSSVVKTLFRTPAPNTSNAIGNSAVPTLVPASQMILGRSFLSTPAAAQPIHQRVSPGLSSVTRPTAPVYISSRYDNTTDDSENESDQVNRTRRITSDHRKIDGNGEFSIPANATPRPPLTTRPQTQHPPVQITYSPVTPYDDHLPTDTNSSVWATPYAGGMAIPIQQLAESQSTAERLRRPLMTNGWLNATTDVATTHMSQPQVGFLLGAVAGVEPVCD